MAEAHAGDAQPAVQGRDRRTLAPAAERGRLTVRERAVNRIACAAAAEVDGVDGTGPPRARGLPRASTVVRDRDATISVHIAVRWPLPLAGVTYEAQRRIAWRVRTLTGLNPERVDVTVDRPAPASGTIAPDRPNRRVL